jgi:hypothetical protein
MPAGGNRELWVEFQRLAAILIQLGLGELLQVAIEG